MTITAQSPRSGPYNGNGSTVAFSYTFLIDASDEIVVVVRNSSTLVETVKVETTDYTVSGVGSDSGGTVTFNTAPTSSEQVTLYRSTDLTQSLDLQNRGSVRPQTLEDSYDKLTKIAQDHAERLARAVTVQVSSTDTDIIFPDTTLAENQNRVIGIDSNGDLTTYIRTGYFDQSLDTIDSPTFAGLTVGAAMDIAEYIDHTGDRNTRFGFPANDTFTIDTAGSEAVRVTSSGNVGIGLINPTVKLDVSGTVSARGNLVAGSDTLIGSSFHVNSTTNITRAQGAVQISNALAGREGYLTLSNGTNATSTALWTLSVDSTDSNSFYLWDDVNSTYPFAVTPGGNSGVLVVDGANDRVGVGTTTPTHPLTVSGDVAVTGNIIHTGDTNTYFGFPSNDTITFTTAGSEAVRVTSSGNVGVGLTNPTVKLDVSGTVAARGNLVAGSDTLVGSKFHVNSTTGVTRAQGAVQISNALAGREGYLTLSNGTNATSTAIWTLSVDSTDSNSFYLWDEVNSTYPFAVTPGANSGVLVVDGANDRVGVGTTSPTHPLTVSGDVAITGNIVHSGDTNTNFGFPANDTITFTTAGSEAVRVASSGNVGIGLTSPTVKLDVSGTVAARGNLVAGSDTLVGSSFHVNSTTNVTRAQGAVQISNALAGREGYLTLSNGTNATSTALWTLSVDSTATNSFYLWDDVNSSYPFAVKPGANNETLVVDGSTDRVGIGTSSPSSTLDVVGTGLFSGRLGIGTDLGANPSGADPDADTLVIDAGGADAGITIDTGTTSKGSLFFADGATGNNLKRGQIVYDHNGDYMAFATNASEGMRINSSGNVGIGTTSPSAKLDVVGGAEVSGDLTVDTNTLHVDSGTNRVGVRNTSPNAPLHVTGATRVQNVLAGREGFLEMYSGSGAGTGLWTLSIDSTDSNAFYLWDEQNSSYPFAVKPGANSETLVVDGSTDRVGIGTSSPSYDLHVSGGSYGKIGLTDVGAGTTHTVVADGTGIGLRADDSFNNAVQIQNDGTFRLRTNGSDRVRVTSSGQVGIGTTSPSAKLDVDGAIKSQSFLTTGQGIDITRGDGAAFGVRIENPSGTAFVYNADDGHFFYNRAETVTHGSFTSSAVIFPAVQTATSALAANVRVQTGGQLVRSTSSLKYKHNVEDADLALSEAVVYGSRPVWYQSLSDLDNDAWGFWGFIAEELHEVDPRLVDYTEDENGDLTPDGVQYDRFVVHLVNVAQQQKAKIDDLESRLAALEAK